MDDGGHIFICSIAPQKDKDKSDKRYDIIWFYKSSKFHDLKM